MNVKSFLMMYETRSMNKLLFVTTNTYCLQSWMNYETDLTSGVGQTGER